MRIKPKYIIGLLVYLGLLWLAETFLRDFHLRLLIQFGLTAIVATGVNLTNGYTNIFSLGFGGTMLVAGYTTALLTLPVKYKEQFLDLPVWLEQLNVPFPMAMLTSARASACESLTPSPIMATVCPSAFSLCTMESLSFGSSCA